MFGPHSLQLETGKGRDTGVTLRSPRRFHNCRAVRLPTHAIVNKPTHFMLTVAPSPNPVRASHIHQSGENTPSFFPGVAPAAGEPGNAALWYFVSKFVHAHAVNAVPISRGESRRMRRDCVTRPFSKMINAAPSRAVVCVQPAERRVMNIRGTTRMPKMAGNNRMDTYGTPAEM